MTKQRVFTQTMYTIIISIISIAAILYCIILLLHNQKLQKRYKQLAVIAKKIEQGTADSEIADLKANNPDEQKFVEILDRINRMLCRKDRALQKFKKIKKMEAHFLSVVRHQLKPTKENCGLKMVKMTGQCFMSDCLRNSYD